MGIGIEEEIGGETGLQSLQIDKIGDVIRKIRKKRGLRLEDLADDNISPATISNIERGIPHVHPDKIRYLLSKLDLDLDALPKLIQEERQELERLRFRLASIETLHDLGHADEALRRIDELSLDDTHDLAAVVYYLKGKCYITKGYLRRAERLLFNAIRLTGQQPEQRKNNLEAAAFCELGSVYFAQHRYEQALQYIENGLSAFHPDGERSQLRYLLLVNKAACLDRLGRTGEAFQTVEILWHHLHQIHHIHTVLKTYELRTELLLRQRLSEDAISCALEGLEIARLNHQYDRAFHLWTLLGNIYFQNRDWENAELCFCLALRLKNRLRDQQAILEAYTRLGLLYMTQEKWDQAREQLDQALKLGRQYPYIPVYADALMAMGNYYRQQGELKEAADHYREAVKWARKNGDRKRERDALFHQAQCLRDENPDWFRSCLEELYRAEIALRESDTPNQP